MPKKGQKKLRGQPELYNEVKGQVNLSLTSTAVQGLDEQATAIGLSRSEFVEQVGRRILVVLLKSDQQLLRQALEQLIASSEADLSARTQVPPASMSSDEQSIELQIEHWKKVLAKLK